MYPPVIKRPTRREGIALFLQTYVVNLPAVLDRFAKEAELRLTSVACLTPSAKTSFDVTCEVRDDFAQYQREYERTLVEDLQNAFATWLVEASKAPGQPDVVCDIRLGRGGQNFTATVYVPYLIGAG